MVKTVTDFARQNDIREIAEIVLDIGELSLVIPLLFYHGERSRIRTA